MADLFTPEKRSEVMSKVRGKNTTPELLVRKELWRRGLRYRIHDRSLPGTPDISNKRRKLVVFIDGCFWHGCPEHYGCPETNVDFWKRKIKRNIARRNEVKAELLNAGYTILEFFECEVKGDLGRVVKRIAAHMGQYPK